MLSNHKLVRGAVLAGLLAMVSACSLLTSSGADQCSTSGDCEALGFTGYTCGGGVCISPINVNPGVVTPQNALGCTSHDSCITANGGRPALCPNPGPQGACVNIATDKCSVYGGGEKDYQNPDAVFIGFVNAGGAPALNQYYLSLVEENQLKLAYDQFVGSLPAGSLPFGVAGARRPPVLLVCEDAGDPAVAFANARHLVSTVKVQALTALWDYAIPEIAHAQAEAKTVIFTECPFCTRDARKLVTGIADTSAFWVFGGTFDPYSPGYRARVGDVETLLRSGALSGDMRVAVVSNEGDLSYSGIGDPISASLKFNGKDIAGNKSTFLRIKYDDRTASWTSIAAQIAAFGAEAVVVQGGVESVRAIVPLTEAMGHHPQWVLSEDQGQLYSPSPLIGRNDSLLKRFSGLQMFPGPNAGLDYSFDAVHYSIFEEQYKSRFPGAPVPQDTYSYDGMWTALYALIAAGPPVGGRLDAAAISRGLLSLQKPGAKAVWAGPDDLVVGQSEIINSGGIRIQTITSNSNFDPVTGMFPGWGGQTYCANRAAQAAIVSATSQFYDPVTLATTGGYDCPP